MEAQHIRQVMKMANGKIEGKNGAAEILGINPATLRHRMRKLGIPFGRSKAYGQSGEDQLASIRDGYFPKAVRTA